MVLSNRAVVLALLLPIVLGATGFCILWWMPELREMTYVVPWCAFLIGICFGIMLLGSFAAPLKVGAGDIVWEKVPDATDVPLMQEPLPALPYTSGDTVEVVPIDIRVMPARRIVPPLAFHNILDAEAHGGGDFIPSADADLAEDDLVTEQLVTPLDRIAASGC